MMMLLAYFSPNALAQVPASDCTPGFCLHNQVQWGSFDVFTTNDAASLALCGSSPNINPFQIAGQNNTPDLIFPTTGFPTTTQICGSTTNIDWGLFDNPDKKMHIHAQGNGNSEGIALPLCTAIPSGTCGFITVDAVTTEECFAFDPNLVFQFTTDAPLPGQNPNYTSAGPINVPITNWVSAGVPVYGMYQIPFNNDTQDDWNFLIVSAMVGNYTELTKNVKVGIVFDNVQLFPGLEVQTTITNNDPEVCAGDEGSVDFQICNLHPNEQCDPFQIQVNLPNGIELIPNAAFTNTTIDVPAGTIPPNTEGDGCHTFTLDYSVSATATVGTSFPISFDINTYPAPQNCIEVKNNSISTTSLSMGDCATFSCDCPEGSTVYNIGNVNTNTNLSTTNLPSGVLSGADITQPCLRIHGNLVIDNNYLFQNVNFIMQPASSITVQSNKTMTSQQCTYSGCEEMWKGIIEMPTATLVLRENTISDAQYAVQTGQNCNLSALKNDFLKNYVSVFNPEGVTKFNLVLFSKNLIACTNTSLLPPYEGQSPTPNARSYAGFELHDLKTGINIGGYSPTTFDNTFQDLSNGILAFNSNLGVFSNRFVNITPNNQYPITGFGIQSSSNTYRAFSQRGTTVTNPIPSFENCGTAIATMGSVTLIIQDNNMQKVGIGINMGMAPHQSGDIYNNQIFCDAFGILGNQSDLSSNFWIRNNYIGVDSMCTAAAPWGSPAKGIAIKLTGQALLSHIKIQNNFIRLWQENLGISLMSLNSFYVVENTVAMQNPSKNRFGIWLSDCTNSRVDCNDIFGFNQTIGDNFHNIGLQAQLSFGSYSNNTFNQNRWGANFIGQCTGTELVANQFDNNAVGLRLSDANSNIGAQLHTGNLWIGNNPQNRIATWVGTTGSFASLFPFTVNPNANPLFKPMATPIEWFKSQLGTANTGNLTCNEIPDVTISLNEEVHSEDLLIAGDENASSNIEETMDYVAKRYLFAKLEENPEILDENTLLDAFWQTAAVGNIGKLNGIEQDKRNANELDEAVRSALLDNGEILQGYIEQLNNAEALYGENPSASELTLLAAEKEFIAAQIDSKMVEQEQLMGDIIATKTAAVPMLTVSNSNVSSNELYEQNEKLINTIYFDAITNGNGLFSAAQKTQLWSVANQCPKTGGRAVFKARSLYEMVADVTYNDNALCQNAQALMEQAETQKALIATKSESEKLLTGDSPFSAKFLPNPAKDKLSCYINTPNIATQLLIYNTLGVLVYDEKINTGTIEVNIEKFEPGLYVARLLGVDNIILYQDKIIVLK